MNVSFRAHGHFDTDWTIWYLILIMNMLIYGRETFKGTSSGRDGGRTPSHILESAFKTTF